MIAALTGIAFAAASRSRWQPTLRIARQDAARSAARVNLGVLPGTGGTQRLARLIGKAKAMELMIKGSYVLLRGSGEDEPGQRRAAKDDWWEKRFC